MFYKNLFLKFSQYWQENNCVNLFRRTTTSGCCFCIQTLNFIYKIGQNVVDKFTKLSKMFFSMEYFKADFGDFLAQLSKFAFRMARWVLTIKCRHFKDFQEKSEVIQQLVKQLMRQLIYSPFGDNEGKLC